jgi:outer membrane protein assembly factor BamA
VCTLAAGHVRAAENAAARRYSPYELESIRRALERYGAVIDTQPQGKTVEAIEVVALDVIEDRDPAPLFLNWLHVTTKPYVIEREVLLKVGKPYEQRRSDETERNLRQLFLFSVVVGLPVKGSTPNSVRYLVVTKDIWSLRASWDGRFNNGVIDFLSFQPTERNLFGTGRQVYGTVIFTATNYTLGAGFVEPRLGGTRLRLSASANAIIGCDSGEVEGSSGTFQYALPLYSSSAKWAYATTVSWSDRTSRLTGSHGDAICSADSGRLVRLPLSSGNAAIVPNDYPSDTQSFTQSFTRSYGRVYKTNLGFGLEARRSAYRGQGLGHMPGINADRSELIDLSPSEEYEARLRYRSLIPANFTRISPYFSVTSYTTNYHRDINSETLGLQEDFDFRLGPYSILKLYPALKRLGSTRDLFAVQATLGYATSVDTGYFKVEASHAIELSPRRQDTDAELSLALRFTSPRLGFGRFVYDVRLDDHYRNFLNLPVALDGTNRLRGYRSNSTIGPSWFASNLEFRTRPVQILSTQWAAVLFHDVGDAFRTFDEIELKQGVGFGLRFLAPQLDRDVFRFDVGFPMPSDAPGGEVTVIAAFGQAFSVP